MSPDDAAPQEHEETPPMIDPGLGGEPGLVEPVAVGPGDPEVEIFHAAGPDRAPIDGAAIEAVAPEPAEAPAAAVVDPGDASLLDLVDRLTAVLERSDLAELEVAAGGTTIILRSPGAVAPVAVAAPMASAGATPAHDAAAPAETASPVGAAAPAAERPSIKAPLTGIYYGAPSPGATPYVAVGNHVSVGQIIGLIEAMKLFNEIKSDLAGRVVRICADSGALVKAKQPLIEVEPA
jgi:acetyl-CoA carboxylase biotin carboxyl carrier protein